MNIPVTLNVKSANAIPVISCMQGDTPILVCTIMNGTEKFVVNKAEFDLCVCEGETAKHKAVTINASISGNTVSVKMTKNETDEAGDIKLCIRFSNTKNNNVISTFPFILKATQNPSYTAVGQMDDVSALTDYVAEAKKYAKEAEDIVGSNFITQAEKGVAGGVAVLNDNLAVAKAVADEDGNNIQETYAKKTEIGEIIEVDSELSATSTNPVQNKIVTAAINSASQQAGIANGKLEQWQAQGRIPNGIANNLVTTEEGYALDARQLNKSVAGSFAESVDKSISAINNSLNNISSTKVNFEFPYHKGEIYFVRIGKYCIVNVKHICVSPISWESPSVLVPSEFRPKSNYHIDGAYFEVRSSGTLAGYQEGGAQTFFGTGIYECAN